MNNKIIIFDFDGVIADSFDIAFEVNQLSKPTLTKERYSMKFNENISKVEYEDKKVREINFFEEYGKRFEFLGIDKAIKETIKDLSKDYSLFIVSSTINSIIKEYLTRHEIVDCFTEILGYDIEKIKVKKFNMIFQKYKIPPEDVVFVTDTSGDVGEAKEAGIGYIIGILGGYQSKESLEKASPNMIIKNFKELDLLKNK